jgi:hypothetical protein
MSPWHLIGSLSREVRAATIDEASSRLKDALASWPEAKTIRISLDPSGIGVAPWLESVKTASPEIRGMMVQRFFARMFSKAGYEVVVGRELDIFARSRLRSLFVEVKSSLAGGRFGSQAVVAQLERYTIASERRGAEIWLGTMGISRPIQLHDNFRTTIQNRNIGLIDISWISPRETLLPHLPSIP